MNPGASATAWHPPRKATGGNRLARFLGAGVLALLLGQYLAGCFFLWSMKLDVRGASPLTIARYAYFHGERVPVRQRLLVTSGIGLLIALGGGGALLLPRVRSLHGDARFATRREIAAAGLLGEHGIILGQFGRRCVMLAGQQGVALAAPPRAGKGTGVVIPNALNWPGSLVCVDIKRENWTITAGYRAKCGQDCYLFDPFAEDGRTARWNPLSYVSSDPHLRVNDLQRIGEMIYPDPPNVDPFWTATARSLFLGGALYVFETPGLPKTIGEVLRQGMASDDEGFGQHWKRVIAGRQNGRYPLSSQCVRALSDVIDLAPVTASSIRKTFTSRLDLWLNPLLDAATSSNSFDLRELRKKPMAIYVAANPDDLHRLRPVLNLFFQQAIGLQTRELPEHNPQLKHQVMILLDELAALGRIPILAEAIPYLPGYNVRVVLVFHTPAQLREVYGANNAETMLKSLAARIVFAPKDFVDAREISDELGYTTVKVKSISKPILGLFDGRARRSRSQSVSEQRRALLLPQEVKELGPEEAIIFYEGLRPILCRKLRYFEDRHFRRRLLPPPQVPAPAWSAEPGRTSAASDVMPQAMVDVTAGAACIEPEKSIESEELQVRDATVEDIERIDSLTLEDFAADFSRVTLPDREGPLSADDMQMMVNSFLDTLDRR